METPNTRSRAKRDLSTPGGSQDEPRVTWHHSQRLYRFVEEQTKDDPPPLPTPTQVVVLPRQPTAASSRPRKRPCRNRSLPQVGSSVPTPATPSLATPASTSELDSLLDRAINIFCPETPPTPNLRSSRTRENRPFRETSTNRPTLAAHHTSSTSISSGSTDRLKTPLEETPSKRSMARTISAGKAASQPRDGVRHAAPRIGLRQTNENKRAPVSKQFRPPLMAVQPIRSSPRRTNSTPIRAVGVVAHTPSTRAYGLRLLPPEEKMPSSDGGTGDESFDSFDGIFAGGGADVEELLRTVDGSQ